MRALYTKEEFVLRQTRTLARLSRANDVALRLKVGPEALRAIYGRLLVPGLPEKQLQSDAVGLLRLPPDDLSKTVDVARVRNALDDLFREEPEPRPFFVDPREPWPRK